MSGWWCCHCNGDDDCPIVADDFSSGDPITDAWEQDTASFTKAAGVVTSTTASKFLINKTAHPAGAADGGTVVADVKGPDDKQARVVLWKSATEYYFLQVEFAFALGDGKVKLGENAGGGETILDEFTIPLSAAQNVFHTLRLCYDGGTAVEGRADFDDGEVALLTATATAIAVTKGGIATGPDAGSTITFDNFSFDRVKESGRPSCPSCDGPTTTCSNWDGATLSEFYKIVIAGVTTDACAIGSDCLLNNGTFIASEIFACDYRKSTGAKCPGAQFCINGGTAHLQFIKVAGDYIMRCFVSAPSGDPCGGVGFVRWLKNFGTTRPDALAFNGESLPYDARGGTDCDGVGSTCLITSL